MRTAYRELLDNFAHDLVIMCDTVEQIFRGASQALLDADLQLAEGTLTLNDSLEEVRQRCEERAVRLLALENPMAKDLRQVVSSIYIVEDLFRMGELGRHIANMARRRHPSPTIPTAYVGYFEELERLCLELLSIMRNLLIDPDADTALALSTDDDAVDDIYHHLLDNVSNRPWKDTTRAAVDIAMLGRFYERFADHTVAVASRVVYLTTGMAPEDYLEKKEQDRAEADIAARFEALERQFRR